MKIAYRSNNSLSREKSEFFYLKYENFEHRPRNKHYIIYTEQNFEL